MRRSVRVLAIAVVLTASAASSAEVTITTGEDVGRPYAAIQPYPAIVYQQFADVSIKGDPLPNAVVKGLEKMRELAESYGADAVVGTRIEFANRTSRDEGRVLVYGTLVKFR